MGETLLTPEQRSLRSRIGAHALHAKHDTMAVSAPGRKAIWRKFEDEVDPDRVLSESERRRRAEHARKAHMARLALASAKARRRKGAS